MSSETVNNKAVLVFFTTDEHIVLIQWEKCTNIIKRKHKNENGNLQ